MSENVIPMPGKNERLAASILEAMSKRDKAIEQEEEGRAAWIASELELCRLFAEAKAAHPSLKDFGAWFDVHVGEAAMNKNDRAAYVKMGSDPTQTRQILETTARRSIRTICDNEFRFPSVGKTTGRASRRPDITKLQRKTIDVIRADPSKTLTEIEKAAGVTNIVARFADAFVRGETAAQSSPAALAAIERRRLMTELRDQIENEVVGEVQAAWDEHFLPSYRRQLAEAAKVVFTRKGVFSQKGFNTVLRCLHPDTGKHVSDELRGDAFRIFKHYETALIRPDVNEKPRPEPLPASSLEMMAQRKDAKPLLKKMAAAKQQSDAQARGKRGKQGLSAPEEPTIA